MSYETDLVADISSDANQHLTFVLSGEEFALPIMQVKEIFEYCTLTTVPLVPSFIRGAINLRGAVVPIIDLARKFGLTVEKVTKRTCIVILEVEMEGEVSAIGVIVDKVLQVIDIPDEDIGPPPSFGTRIRTDFIKGMNRKEGQFTIILDVDRILSFEEISVVGSVDTLPATSEDQVFDMSGSANGITGSASGITGPENGATGSDRGIAESAS